jgi:hypothetical protein
MAIHNKLYDNKFLQNIFDNFEGFCAIFSLRFALILALNFGNPDLDLFNLAKIDITYEILEDLFSNDFIFEIIKIVKQYEYVEGQPIMNDKYEKLITDIVNRRMDNYDIYHFITRKLNNNLLFIISTVEYYYINDGLLGSPIEIQFEKSIKSFNVHIIKNLLEPKFQKIITEAHTEIQKLGLTEFDSLNYYISECFKYLKSSTITYKEEQDILKSTILTKALAHTDLTNKSILQYGFITGGKIVYKLFK